MKTKIFIKMYHSYKKLKIKKIMNKSAICYITKSLGLKMVGAHRIRILYLAFTFVDHSLGLKFSSSSPVRSHHFN